MPKNTWHGEAVFKNTDNIRHMVMTVCPGNPMQEGNRFYATMEACAKKLDSLTIIQAGALGVHNLKRYNPKDVVLDFARLRGQKWEREHESVVKEFFGDRAKIIPIEEITCDSSYKDRVAAIRAIYNSGNNQVTEWFDCSIKADLQRKSERKEKSGVQVAEWALREDALDYLCAEYAMRTLLWEKFGLPEAYVGRSVYDPNLFQACNTSRPDLNLTIPSVVPVEILRHEVKHDRKSGGFNVVAKRALG